MNPDYQALLMQMLGAHENLPPAQGDQVGFQDSTQPDWGSLTSRFSLTPEELQQLQLPTPPNGPSLAQRLQALRPGVDIGNLRLTTDGRQLRGRMIF